MHRQGEPLEGVKPHTPCEPTKWVGGYTVYTIYTVYTVYTEFTVYTVYTVCTVYIVYENFQENV